jgi:DNA-binding transcriptional regulator of glucitol operon
MSKQKKPVGKNAKSGRFAIGTARFLKISAVEGIQMTPAMKKRAAEARAKGLSAEEYRRTIIRSYRKD